MQPVTPAPEGARTTIAPVTRLGSLVAPKALTVKALRRAGLQLQVAVPDGARTLRLQLLPRRGKRTGAAVATAMVRLSAGGAQRIHWRLPAATVKRLGGPLHPPGPGGQGCPFDRTGPARAHARAARPLTPGATPTDGRRRPARLIPRRAPSALCGSRLAVRVVGGRPGCGYAQLACRSCRCETGCRAPIESR